MASDNPSLDPRATALVIIDLQQGIVGRTTAPHTAEQVVANAARLGRRCNERGMPVFPVHVTYSSDGKDRPTQAVDEAAPVPPSLPANWADLVPEIASLEATNVITKRQWGAFYGTELDLQLRRRGITTIILCGIATNFGVESTAREAWQHSYNLIIAEDACTSVDSDMHSFAIKRILPRLGKIRSTADILAAL